WPTARRGWQWSRTGRLRSVLRRVTRRPPPTATTSTPCTASTTSRAGTATRYGWTAGAGLEYAFDKHLSGVVVYDHLRRLSQIINFTTNPVPALPAGAGAATTTRLVSLNIDRVVGGVDYRF